MTFETITTEQRGAIGIITFNRPKVLNALSSTLMRETTAAMDAFVAEPTVRVIVLHGAGRSFSAGFDLKEQADRGEMDPSDWRAILDTDFEFIMQFWDCPKPTIAAVHGHCLAGAFETALACDITVAAEGTRFGEPEVRFGAGIVALLLPWFVSPKHAKELLLTGTDRLDAERALAMGIVNHVVPAGQELEQSLGLAADIAAAGSVAVQMTKRAVNRTYEMMNMRQALLAALDTDVILESMAGPERKEFGRIRKEQGLKAALAWRDARFRDN